MLRVPALRCARLLPAPARTLTLTATGARAPGPSRRAVHRAAAGSSSSSSRSDADDDVAAPAEAPVAALRNLSVWGHIDAGKTTLTEKLLFLAGALAPPPPPGSEAAAGAAAAAAAARAPGAVDSGSTVTDFLEEERRRGITIQSAAVGPFRWRSALPPDECAPGRRAAAISLVDTPGHIDFTIEVERALRVADACVVLLDAVAGVESQTEGVWAIARRYGVRSHVVFVNKLDRAGASLPRSLRAVARHLHARPVLLQLPLLAPVEPGRAGGGITGLVDVVTQQLLQYSGAAGEVVTRTPLAEALRQELVPAALAAEATRARHALVETLAELDDALLDELLSSPAADAHAALPARSLRAALRRLVRTGAVLPVLCGSAARGIGVQEVLDAIVAYFPSPDEAGDPDAAQSRERDGGCVWATLPPLPPASRPKAAAAPADAQLPQTPPRVAVSIGDAELAALAFKVVWDKRRGPLTFVRVYAGSITRASMLYNTTSGARERHSKLLLPYADRYVETETLRAGQIGVLLGLRDTRTGDTFVDARLAKAAAGGGGGGSAAPWAARARELRLRSIDVPPPVFSMSIEPASRADEADTSEALAMLVRTDPSLRLDDGGAGSGGLGAAGTGQMVLSGMGELHLDIARGRLADEFGAKARMGSVRVSYRETVLGTQAARVEELIDREMLGKQVKAGITCEVRQLAEDEAGDEQMGDNVVLIDLDVAPDEFADVPKAAASNSSGDELSPAVLRAALLAGATAGLSRGPLSGNALSRLHVQLSAPRTFGTALTPPRALSAVTRAALLAAVRQLEPGLMEPVMRLRIACKEASLGRIVADLTGEQGGTVLAVEHEDMGTGEHEASADAGTELYVPPDDAAPLPDGDGDAVEGRTVIHASAPLARLVAYSSRLRALSAGSAAFEMRLDGFAPVSPERRTEILRELGRAA